MSRLLEALRLAALRWALREIRVQVNPKFGTLWIMTNGHAVPRGTKVLVAWPGRAGLRDDITMREPD